MASVSELVKNLVADINTKVQGEVTAATEAVISEVRDNIIGPAVSNINSEVQNITSKIEIISNLQSTIENLTTRVQALENAANNNAPQEEEPPTKEEPKEESLEP